jgi:hypothetical protein
VIAGAAAAISRIALDSAGAAAVAAAAIAASGAPTTIGRALRRR